MIALREAWQAGLLQRQHWLNNIIAGVVVGVVALPLAMAFAIASGALPQQGIYTAIVAAIAVSVFGGSRVQIAGPTGAFIVILAAITAKHGIDGLQIATLMAGIILVLFGVTRMGNVIKFIPAPVIVGFTAGIGVIIWVGQWQYFFGVPAPVGEHFHQKFWHLLFELPHLQLQTTAIACLALGAVIFGPRVPGLRRVPGPLLALVLATLAHVLLHLPTAQVATIGSAFGGIPRGLPHLTFPDVTVARVIELIGPAFTIAMLGAIESLLTAVVADGMAGTRHNSNQELFGQGIANLLTPLFGGFAATGAIARTATNIRNGGNSPLAGIVHSITLIAVLLILAPLAADIPLAALAAVLFVVSWNMSEPSHVLSMLRRAPKADIVILVITFLLTVFVDLVVAVNIGVILATMHFLRRMSNAVEVQEQDDAELGAELQYMGRPALPDRVLVYSIGGPFFFGAVEKFERALANTRSDPKVIILRLRRVPFVDMTALETMEEVVHDLHRRGVVVVLCEANYRVSGKLAKAGIIDVIGIENFFQEFPSALDRSATLVHAHLSSAKTDVPA